MGIIMNGVKMYYNNKEVFFVLIRVGLFCFIDFLNKDLCKKFVIIGYNIKLYDIFILLNVFFNWGIINVFY